MARMLSVFFTRRPRFAHLNKKPPFISTVVFLYLIQTISLNHSICSKAAK